MAMFDNTFRRVTPLPESLPEIFQKILNPSNPSADHQEFVNDVKAVKAECDKEDDDYAYLIQMDIANGVGTIRERYYDAYINYLGMALHYQEKSNSDAAWYYYGQSRYYLGLYDTFDSVLRSIEARYNEKKVPGSQGAKKKAQIETGPMRKRFTEIIKSPPQGGWESENQLLAAAEPELQSFHIKSGHKYILFENILKNAKKWLKTDEDIEYAYAINSSDPDNALQAIRNKSENLTDLLIKEFVRIIKSPPQGGWVDFEQLLAVAEPKLQAIQQDAGQSLPFDEKIRSCTKRWMQNIRQVWSAYYEHSRDHCVLKIDVIKPRSDDCLY